jgi:hypothetical protein
VEVTTPAVAEGHVPLAAEVVGTPVAVAVAADTPAAAGIPMEDVTKRTSLSGHRYEDIMKKLGDASL